MYKRNRRLLAILGQVRTVGIACLGLLSVPLVFAEKVAGWQFQWENDTFGRGKTDRWYTNGMRLSWTFDDPPKNEVSKTLLDGSRWFLWKDANPTIGYTFGQTMYSPKNINESGPQLNDRPWGAYLYGGVTTHAFKNAEASPYLINELRATELKFGVTGRYAFGEEVQKFAHQIVASDTPQGWDHQLRSRLGVQVSHARVRAIGDELKRDWFGFQWGWGASVGTLRMNSNVNAAVTFGDLTGSNAPLLIGNEGDFVLADFNSRNQFNNVFGFLAANVTGVAYNYFITGSTPYGSSNLEIKRAYTMIQAGFSLPLERWLGSGWPRLVYAISTKSPEFKSRIDGEREERQQWGTLSVHWDK